MRRTVLILSLFFIPALLSAQVNFNFSFYQTSGQGLVTVTADFNRDGYPDVAVGTSRAFEIFLSTNKGTSFGAPHSYPLPQDPQDMVAVDVNGDGWPDLVVLPSGGSKTVPVFLNNGYGTLRAGTPITLAAPAGNYISAGDVNNDGKVDLVISETTNNGSASQFAIYKGNGNGTFAAGQVITLTNLACRPVVYDLNRDGKLDIASAARTNAVVYWGNGDGTFRGPTVIPESDSNGDSDLIVADFNNDTNPDLAIMTSQFRGSACGQNTIYLYLGNGSGSFTLTSWFVVGFISAGGTMVAADLNDDQNMDIVVANPVHYGGGVMYALGNGNGTFGT